MSIKTKLPRTIDLVKFIEQREHLEGVLALAEMPRLQEIANPKEKLGGAKVIMDGGVDQQGLQYLRGQVTTDVPLQCQRCLQTMMFHADIKFLLSPVHDDKEAKQLPNIYEALYLTDAEVDLITMIEDELLLVLPLVPKHENKGKCKGTGELQVDAPKDVQEKRTHPFAKLAELKKKRKSRG